MRLVWRVRHRAGLLLTATALVLSVLLTSEHAANQSSETEAQHDQAADDAEAASDFDTGIDKNDHECHPEQLRVIFTVVIWGKQHPHSVASPPNGSNIDAQINKSHAHGVNALAEDGTHPPKVKHLEDH